MREIKQDKCLKSKNGIIRDGTDNIILIWLSSIRPISKNLDIIYLMMFKWYFQTEYCATILGYHTTPYYTVLFNLLLQEILPMPGILDKW